MSEPTSTEATYAERTTTVTPDLLDALASTFKGPSDPEGSPIYHALAHQLREYASSRITLRMRADDHLEPLSRRLFQRDVAKGVIDPDLLGSGARDYLDVEMIISADEPDSSAGDAAGAEATQCSNSSAVRLELPAFMAHLATPMGLVDPEHDDAIMSPLWDDGSWTGTLMWDSAVHATERLLTTGYWRERLSAGASVVELGCGLALPGFACHALGASPVLLTDRSMVTDLCGEAIVHNQLPSASIRAVELDWSAEGAKALCSQHLDGKKPDVIIACDCVFAALFGAPYLLLEMLMLLTEEGGGTKILLALERRVDDGADGFFAQAAEAGFSTRLVFRLGRVLICEMERGAAAAATAGGGGDTGDGTLGTV